MRRQKKYDYEQGTFVSVDNQERYRKEREGIENATKSLRDLKRFMFLARVVLWFCLIMCLVYFWGIWGR